MRAAAKQSPHPTPTTRRKEILDGQPPNPRPHPSQPPAPPDPDRSTPEGRDGLLAHLQTSAAGGGHQVGDWPLDQITNGFAGDLDARHHHDHTRLATKFTHTHPTEQPDPLRGADRGAEHAFDRLNPDFGIPADHHDSLGHHDVADREAALSLGTRVAIHDRRQNDPDPHIWQPGQDYRAADAIDAARRELVRAGPER